MDSLIHRKASSGLEKFLTAPLETVASTLYRLQRIQDVLQTPSSITIVCISDTHSNTDNILIPPGDVLIRAGDLTQSGTAAEVQQTLDWLSAQSNRYNYIVAIAGNHEKYLDPIKRKPEGTTAILDWDKVIYLEDSSTTLKFSHERILKVYGSPWTIKSRNWAFEYPKGEDHWTGPIPNDVDILITHSPPLRHLDLGHRATITWERALEGEAQIACLWAYPWGSWGGEVGVWCCGWNIRRCVIWKGRSPLRSDAVVPGVAVIRRASEGG
jgi:hypothetical protein